MSPLRLKRIHTLIQRAVETGSIGGAVGLVARSNRIVSLEAVGKDSKGRILQPDAIFRLASITKPITATAVLILYERGEIDLNDPVEKYLPEWQHVVVAARDKGGEMTGTEPVTRSLTIYDLLTHQAGIAGEGDDLFRIWDQAKTAREFCTLLSKLPLRSQPGTQFYYGQMGTSYEVLGALIEVVSRTSLESFVTREILQPLKMDDTYFYVPVGKKPRMAAPFTLGTDGKLQPLTQREQRTEFYSGGGGLRSSVRDYYRFAQFLLNEGTLDGVRLLSPLTVRHMTMDQVSGRHDPSDAGWGWGVEVHAQAVGPDIVSAGAFGWNGGTGTLFLVDPREDLIAIIFSPASPSMMNDLEGLRRAFITAAYQAITVPKTHR